jgi:hypothetical protein
MLQVLYLHKNKLSGSLPAAWAGMESLQDLTLNENKFTGEAELYCYRFVALHREMVPLWPVCAQKLAMSLHCLRLVLHFWASL